MQIDAKCHLKSKILAPTLVLLFLSYGVGVAEEVVVRKTGSGLYGVPVRVNEVITLDFLLDTGASEVAIPQELYSVLKQAGTVGPEHTLPDANVKLADGSTKRLRRFIITRMTVGGHTLSQVKAIIGELGSALLLGQSALQQLPNWRLDTQREVLQFSAIQEPSPIPQSADEAIQKLVEIYGSFLEVRTDIDLGDYEGKVEGKLVPRLIVAQEKLQSLSATASGLSNASFGPDLRDLFISVNRLLDRQNSWLSLKILSYDGQSAGARLEALQQLVTDDMNGLHSGLFSLFAKPENAGYAKLFFQTIARYPEQFYRPGQTYAGLWFADAGRQPGVLVVFADSPAERAGLKPGDRIVHIDSKTILTTSEATERLGTLGGHTLGVLSLDGSQHEVSLEVSKFVPFQRQTVTEISLVLMENDSITPSALEILRNLLMPELRKLANPENLVYVSWFKPPDDKNLGFADLARRYRADYFVAFSCRDYEIRRVPRLGGPVRMGVIEIEYSLYDARANKVIARDSIVEKLDELAGGASDTFSVLQHRLVERWLEQLRARIEYR